MQTTDVSDALVYACFDEIHPNRSATVLEALQAQGVPFRVAADKLERMISHGLLARGASPTWVWLTHEGAEAAGAAILR